MTTFIIDESYPLPYEFPQLPVPSKDVPTEKINFFAAKTQSFFTLSDRIKYTWLEISRSLNNSPNFRFGLNPTLFSLDSLLHRIPIINLIYRMLTPALNQTVKVKKLLIFLFLTLIANIFFKEIVKDIHSQTHDSLSQELSFYHQTLLIQKAYRNFVRKPSEATFTPLSRQFEELHSLNSSDLLPPNTDKSDQHRQINTFLNNQVGGNVAQVLLEFAATQGLKPQGELTETSFKEFYNPNNYVSTLTSRMEKGYGTKKEISDIFTTVFNKVFNEDLEKNLSIFNRSQLESEETFIQNYVKEKISDLLEVQNCDDSHKNSICLPGISPQEQASFIETHSHCVSTNTNYKKSQRELEKLREDLNHLQNVVSMKEIEVQMRFESFEKAVFKFETHLSKIEKKISEFAKEEYSKFTIFMKYAVGTTLSEKEIFEIDAINGNHDLLIGIKKTQKEFLSIITS